MVTSDLKTCLAAKLLEVSNVASVSGRKDMIKTLRYLNLWYLGLHRVSQGRTRADIQPTTCPLHCLFSDPYKSRTEFMSHAQVVAREGGGLKYDEEEYRTHVKILFLLWLPSFFLFQKFKILLRIQFPGTIVCRIVCNSNNLSTWGLARKHHGLSVSMTATIGPVNISLPLPCVRVNVCMHICVCMYICLFERLYVYMHISIWNFISRYEIYRSHYHVFVCMYACMYVCVYVFVYVYMFFS